MAIDLTDRTDLRPWK